MINSNSTKNFDASPRYDKVMEMGIGSKFYEPSIASKKQLTNKNEISPKRKNMVGLKSCSKYRSSKSNAIGSKRSAKKRFERIQKKLNKINTDQELYYMDQLIVPINNNTNFKILQNDMNHPFDQSMHDI